MLTKNDKRKRATKEKEIARLALMVDEVRKAAVTETQKIEAEELISQWAARDIENNRRFTCAACGRGTYYKMYEPYCTRKCAWRTFLSMPFLNSERKTLKEKLQSIPPVSQWFRPFSEIFHKT